MPVHLAVAHRTRVRIWDIKSFPNFEKSSLSEEVTHLGLSGKGSKVILRLADKSVEVRDVITDRIELKKSGQRKNSIISFDGTRVASIGQDDCLRVWNAVNGNTEITVECPLGDNYFAFSPDSTTLVLRTSNRAVKVWNLVARKLEQIIPWEPDGPVTISPDGTKASFNVPWHIASPIEILCLKRGQVEHRLERTGKLMSALAISHHNSLVAVGFGEKSGSGSLDIWNTTSHKTAMSIIQPDAYALSLLFSPQDTRIASGWTDETVKIWNIATGQAEWVLTAHCNIIYTLAFSGDDRWNEEPFYAAGEGKRWITYGGRSVLALPREFQHTDSRLYWPNESRGNTLAFKGDNKRLAICAFEGAPDFERANSVR